MSCDWRRGCDRFELTLLPCLWPSSARQLPFDHDNIPSLLAMIKRGHYEMHDSITGEARDLIQRMLVKDVEMRIPVSCR